MIKLAAVADTVLFERLEASATEFLDPDSVESCESRWLVDRSIALTFKNCPPTTSRLISRRLHFGHTVSPRLEAQSGYMLRRGEAVATCFTIPHHALLAGAEALDRTFDLVLTVQMLSVNCR